MAGSIPSLAEAAAEERGPFPECTSAKVPLRVGNLSMGACANCAFAGHPSDCDRRIGGVQPKTPRTSKAKTKPVVARDSDKYEEKGGDEENDIVVIRRSRRLDGVVLSNFDVGTTVGLSVVVGELVVTLDELQRRLRYWEVEDKRLAEEAETAERRVAAEKEWQERLDDEALDREGEEVLP
jgi:hypothetical protein